MAGDQRKRRAPARRSKGSVGEAHSNGTGGASPGPVLMDLEFVRHLIDAIDDSGIDTIEISRGGTRIRISKSPPQAAVMTSGAVAAAAAPVAAPPAHPTADSSVAADTEALPAPSKPAGPDLDDVTSPMVGTFYRAPAPEAPPYVEIGSTVTKGQTLCILEAMKLMNELESEVDGVVREILVENADPVEYGQVLFRIEPSGTA